MNKYFGLARELLDRGLAKEIEPYDENNTYDTAIQFSDDLDFYMGLAREQGGKVLDIGCGTGRVMLPLLQAGIDVVGMDLSPHMLRLTTDKLSSAGFAAHLHCGDMRDFRLDQEFRLIIIPYYSMIYMTTDGERLRVLQCCHRHLAPGGLLAFDFDAGSNEPGLTKPWLGFQTISPNGEVIVQTNQMKQVDEHLRIVNMVTYRMWGNESRIDVKASVEASISTSKMTNLLEKAGFSVREFYQDYTKTPYSGGEECVAIAEKHDVSG